MFDFMSEVSLRIQVKVPGWSLQLRQQSVSADNVPRLFRVACFGKNE
jgi:hypothetical protein